MTGRSFNSHHISHFKREVGGIYIVAFAGVLELHFNHIVIGIPAGDVVEIVEAVELASDGATASTARGAGSPGGFGATSVGIAARATAATGFVATVATSGSVTAGALLAPPAATAFILNVILFL